MNAIQSGNLHVKELGSYSDLTSCQSYEAGRMVRSDSKSYDAQVKKIDLSQLSEQDKERLSEEIDKHNKQFSYTGKYLKFKYDEEAKTSIVEVVDTSTNEVIVSLPPEFLIDLSIKMKKILGIYIDEKL